MNEELRSAILDRDFERAQLLISEQTNAFVSEIGDAAGEPQRRRLLEEAVARIEQNLYLARIVRAHIASELQANSASFLYVDAELEQPRWRLSA